MFVNYRNAELVAVVSVDFFSLLIVSEMILNDSLLTDINMSNL